MPIIYVEGIIGSGKTTMAPRLVEYLCANGHKAKFIPEPVELWKTSGMLEKFYTDMRTHALEFHLYVLKTMIDQLQRELENTDTILVCERSIHTVKNVFMKNLLKTNMITQHQFEKFTYEWNKCVKKIPEPLLCVWLDTPLSTCMERVRQRSRLNESTAVSEEYQQQLWDLHKKYFSRVKSPRVVSPQISLDFKNTIHKKSYEENFMEYIVGMLF